MRAQNREEDTTCTGAKHDETVMMMQGRIYMNIFAGCIQLAHT
jgi:hypothetical protein